MNKLYVHPELGDLLDNGEVDYAILDALEVIYKKRRLDIQLHTDYAR